MLKLFDFQGWLKCKWLSFRLLCFLYITQHRVVMHTCLSIYWEKVVFKRYHVFIPVMAKADFQQPLLQSVEAFQNLEVNHF